MKSSALFWPLVLVVAFFWASSRRDPPMETFNQCYIPLYQEQLRQHRFDPELAKELALQPQLDACMVAFGFQPDFDGSPLVCPTNRIRNCYRRPWSAALFGR